MPDHPPSTPITQNTYHRPKRSLNGDWAYLVDPYETGFRFQRNWKPFDAYDELPRCAFGADSRKESPSDLIEYDYLQAPRLSVPGDWNHQVSEILYYEGSIWYQREFDYALADDRRLYIRFEAANYEADVYFNGVKLGHHLGGFDPFEFEITDRVRTAGNTVVVRVNNRREPASVPGMTTDWWNYGGLTREVFLFEVPSAFIADYHLQITPAEPDVVTGYVRIDGAKGGTMVTVSVPEVGASTAITTDDSGYAEVRLPTMSLQRWSPENPKLYTVLLDAPEDQVEDEIGFRTIERDGPEILLNGEPIFLRGVSLHEEIPDGPRRAWSADDACSLLGKAEELGCNFVRLAHYPHNEHMPRLAEKRGLLLWEEIPVYWGIHYDDENTYAVAESQLRGLVHRDKNRASVIIWSIANETPVTPARTRFLGRLKSVVRAIDSQRLISAALDRDQTSTLDQISVRDPFADEVDLVSCNQYLGWYYGHPGHCTEVVWTVDPHKPFVMSEFGAGAVAGRHGPKEEIWTEENQAWLYQEQLAMMEKIPSFRGCSPWNLSDFRSPRRNLSGIQDHWNRKGLISADGEKKQAYFVLRAFYERMKDWELDHRRRWRRIHR